MYSNNGLQLVNWVGEMAEASKESQKKFLSYFIQLLEHALRLKHSGNQHLTLLEAEQKIVQTLLQKGVQESAIEKISQLLNEAIYYVERNANSKILFHNVSLKVQQILRSAALPV
jgi:DNA polymerase-3 subunit delta'